MSVHSVLPILPSLILCGIMFPPAAGVTRVGVTPQVSAWCLPLFHTPEAKQSAPIASSLPLGPSARGYSEEAIECSESLLPPYLQYCRC